MSDILENLSLKKLSINELKIENTAIIVVDMVKGFVEEGILSSPRVKAMSSNLLELNKKTKNYNKVFFIDSHKADAIELRAYPSHCIENTKEEELIDELKEALNYEKNISVIKKNSTNGFHVPKFKSWIENNMECINNFVVIGCVTDICVFQFATTLKTYFNQIDLDKRVIVPVNCVETFDIPGHDGDQMNYFALYSMLSNGIEVVSEIE